MLNSAKEELGISIRVVHIIRLDLIAEHARRIRHRASIPFETRHLRDQARSRYRKKGLPATKHFSDMSRRIQKSSETPSDRIKIAVAQNADDRVETVLTSYCGNAVAGGSSWYTY